MSISTIFVNHSTQAVRSPLDVRLPEGDLRRSSPNFGKWVGVELSADNKRQLWVPPDFAHGFVVTSEFAEFLYKTTDYWYPDHERSLLWCDPTVGVQWPVDGEPKLAAKDAAGKVLAEADCFA